MLAKLTRVGFLLFLAVMVLSWAVTASRSKPQAEPQDDQTIGSIFC